MQLEGYAARLALVLHLTRWASGESVKPDVCDVTSMEHGIMLARWFANEARRIHSMLCETADQRDRRVLIDWLHRRGGQASSRDLNRANGRRYPTIDAAESALNRLAEEGVGGWVNQPAGKLGGRPFRVLDLGRAKRQGPRNKGQTGVPSDTSSRGTSVAAASVGRISNPAFFSIGDELEPTSVVVPAMTEAVSTSEATGGPPIPRMAVTPAQTEGISAGNGELCRTDHDIAPSAPRKPKRAVKPRKPNRQSRVASDKPAHVAPKKAAVKKATSVAKTEIVAPATSAAIPIPSTTPTESPSIAPYLEESEQQIREEMERRRKQWGPSTVTNAQLALPGQPRR